MKKQIDIELNITPYELAKELWEMDASDQAAFLCELAKIFRYNKNDFYSQLWEVCHELNKEGSYWKASIIRLVETLLEYVKGGNDNESNN